VETQIWKYEYGYVAYSVIIHRRSSRVAGGSNQQPTQTGSQYNMRSPVPEPVCGDALLGALQPLTSVTQVVSFAPPRE
jgi:hypothetical protein